MNADELFDPEAGAEAPDPLLERLEAELSAHRWSGAVPDVQLPDRAGQGPAPSAWRWRLALAAAALVVLGLTAWLRLSAGAGAGPGYTLEILAGAPRVEGDADAASLHPGQRLVCDVGDRARLRISDIGSVDLESDSSLRVEDLAAAADGAEHLLWLERGRLRASIFAAPRLFQVGTPAGIAVDMGCIYEASVDEDGTTRLSVVSGQVSFETGSRRVTVPAGASTWAGPRRGPGTPVWDDAAETFRSAVRKLDHGAEDALAAVLDSAREQDSLTLWHLLGHDAATVRAAVYDRLALRVPPPPGVTREACLSGDVEALERWKDAMGWGW